MQQPSTSNVITIIKDGAIASSITLATIGLVSIIVPGVPRPALAATSGAIGVAVATGQQQRRLRSRLHQDLEEFQQGLQQWAKALPLGKDPLSLDDFDTLPSLDGAGGVSEDEPDSPQRGRPPKLSKPLSSLRQQEGRGVITWLTQVGIGVESYYQPQPEFDEIFDRVSVFLGTHYTSLEPLYRRIKRNVAEGKGFHHNLSSNSQREISLSTQFGKMLDRSSLTSFYRYSSTDKLIHATMQNRPDLIRLFQGEWFERYVANEVARWLDSKSLRYECLINPQITYANGDRFELDLVFMVEDDPLWIECKTGKNYNAYLQRYSGHRKQLNISKRRSLLVILDLPSDQARTLTTLWDITVTNQELLMDYVEVALGTAPEVADEDSEAEHTRDLLVQIPRLLRDKRVPPVPEYRLRVLQALIRLVEKASPPMNLSEVKDSLYEELKDLSEISNVSEISKTKIQGILKAILRSGYLLDQDHQPVTNFHTPICGLVAGDPEALEIQCVRQYASVVLAAYPTFFDQPQQVQVFEEVVGAPAPDAATLDELSRQLLDQAVVNATVSDEDNGDSDGGDDDSDEDE